MPKRLLAASLFAVSVAMSGLLQAGFATDTAATTGDTQISPEMMEQGAELYKKNCRLCHGSKGTSGKPLAGNEMLADAEYVAGVILTGPGYMASFADHLTDDEIALIMTYVRNSWGNSYGPVDPGLVAGMR